MHRKKISRQSSKKIRVIRSLTDGSSRLPLSPHSSSTALPFTARAHSGPHIEEDCDNGYDQGRWLAQNRHALSVWPHISGTTMGIPSAAAAPNNVSRSSMTISPPTRAGNFRPIRRNGICRARRTDGAKHFLGQTWTVLTALAVTVPLKSPASTAAGAHGELRRRRGAISISNSQFIAACEDRGCSAGSARPQNGGRVSAGSAVRLAFDVLVMTVLSCEGCHSSP